MTEQLTLRAVRFIEQESAAARPFFLLLAHPMPGVPLQASVAFQGHSTSGAYGDVLEELDASVGDLQLALERSGVLHNTLFIFTSDHGPWLIYGDHAGSTAGLRGGKGSSFEGGVRVPFLASWPGVIRAGSQCDQPLMNIDLLPSIAAWIGADLPARAIDGRDVRHLLSGVGAAGDGGTAYYFWGPGNELEAMRLGRWKLHFAHRFRSVPKDFAGSGGEAGRYRYGQSIALSLFDLAMDPKESRPVQDEFPEVLKRLQQLAQAKRRELGDALLGIPGFGRRPPARDL